MALLVTIGMYKKEVSKELEYFDLRLKKVFMAPKDDIERVEDKLDGKLTKLSEDFVTFKTSVVQRLTRLETIIWLLFSSNSVASVAVFLYSYLNSK